MMSHATAPDASPGCDPAPLSVQPRRLLHALALPLAFLLAFAGLFTAAILSFGHLLDVPVPCGASRGCGAVAAHASSKLLGVPIAYIGVGAYLLLIVLLTRSPHARWSRLLFALLTFIGAAASLGLMYYSQTVIRATCTWCVASGAIMLGLVALAIPLVQAGSTLKVVKPHSFWLLALLTASAVGIQAGFMQKAANAPPVHPARLALLSAEHFIDEAKSKGPSDAPVTIVMFSDPWCTACARMHAALAEYQQAHDSAVRIAYRHVPLWAHSGATAALSEIAAEHGQFWPFMKSVYEGRVRPLHDAYVQLMNDLGVPADDIVDRVATADDPAVLRVWRDVALAESLGITATPTFIVLIKDRPPVSASQRTLIQILNSPLVHAHLGRAATPDAEVSE